MTIDQIVLMMIDDRIDRADDDKSGLIHSD